MGKQAWSKNPYLRNGKLADLYLFWLRRGWRIPVRIVEMMVGSQIACPIPERLFLPHPFGIVTGTCCVIENDVVLLQQVTLGGRFPYYDPSRDPEKMDPILKQGVYVGPGAKILGHVTIGEWSIVGANAVITIDVPQHSIVVGHNRILEQKSTGL